MATKTISIDLEAYGRLCAARRNPKDSFSQVIKRASWEERAKTCEALLHALPGIPTAGSDVLAYLESAQSGDAPPDDSWA